MSIQLQWDTTNHSIIQFNIQGQWDNEMYHVTTDSLLHLLYDVSHPVNVIINVTEADASPLGYPLATEIDYMLRRLDGKVEAVVVVGDDTFTRELTFALSHKDNDGQGRVFITRLLKRAREIITENAYLCAIAAPEMPVSVA